jgi:hypothetical protein
MKSFTILVKSLRGRNAIAEKATVGSSDPHEAPQLLRRSPNEVASAAISDNLAVYAKCSAEMYFIRNPDALSDPATGELPFRLADHEHHLRSLASAIRLDSRIFSSLIWSGRGRSSTSTVFRPAFWSNHWNAYAPHSQSHSRGKDMTSSAATFRNRSGYSLSPPRTPFVLISMTPENMRLCYESISRRS